MDKEEKRIYFLLSLFSVIIIVVLAVALIEQNHDNKLITSQEENKNIIYDNEENTFVVSEGTDIIIDFIEENHEFDYLLTIYNQLPIKTKEDISRAFLESLIFEYRNKLKMSNFFEINLKIRGGAYIRQHELAFLRSIRGIENLSSSIETLSEIERITSAMGYKFNIIEPITMSDDVFTVFLPPSEDGALQLQLKESMFNMFSSYWDEDERNSVLSEIQFERNIQNQRNDFMNLFNLLDNSLKYRFAKNYFPSVIIMPWS